MLKFRHFFTNSRIPGYKFLRHVIYPPISSLRDIKNHLLYQISSLLLPVEVPPSDRNDRMLYAKHFNLTRIPFYVEKPKERLSGLTF